MTTDGIKFPDWYYRLTNKSKSSEEESKTITKPSKEKTEEKLLYCPECMDKQPFRYDPKTLSWICQVCGRAVTEDESEAAEDEEDDEIDAPAYDPEDFF